MVSNHDRPRLKNSQNVQLSELIRYLHLKETDSYRQRLEVIRKLEKYRKRMIAEINQLFHDSFQSYEHHWHGQSKDIRQIREYLEKLDSTENATE